MSATASDFSWLGPLAASETSQIAFSSPGTALADGDWYLDATSPKRGAVLAMEGEIVPQGGLYITKSSASDELWARLQLAASGKL